jgi:hypothetical protein
MPIGRLVDVGGSGVRRAVARQGRLSRGLEVLAQRAVLQVERHVEEADPDEGADAAPLTAEERGEDSVAQRVTAGGVDDGETHLRGGAARVARQRHHPALSLDDEVDSATQAPLWAESESGDGRVHDAGVARPHVIRSEPEPVHCSRQRGLEHNIRVGDEFPGAVAVRRLAQVEPDSCLVASRPEQNPFKGRHSPIAIKPLSCAFAAFMITRSRTLARIRHTGGRSGLRRSAVNPARHRGATA